MRHPPRPFFLAAASLLLAAPSRTQEPTAEAASPPPNIVLILADDLGYGDLGCYQPDARTRTPHLDRLAREGVRLTDAHAPAAVCVPTRYGVMTGRYPFRRERVRGQRPLLPEGGTTIASLLRDRGYATAGVGKWHLGLEHEKDPAGHALRGGPIDRGFERYFGIPASLDIPPYYFFDGDRCVAPPTGEIAASSTPGWSPIQGAFWRAGKIAPGFRHADVLPILVEKSVAYLRELDGAKPAKPFFLYVALTAPHTPWLPHDEPAEGPREASAARAPEDPTGIYGRFVREVDAGVGRILAELDRLGRRGDTLVIFTNDNGPVWYPRDVERTGHAASGPLRGMKGDAWEGGHRVPFLARWPGQIAAGAVRDDLACQTDLLATFAALVGAALPDDAGEDSFDLSGALFGREPEGPVRDSLVSQSSRGVLAIRRGRWKLIPQLGSGGFSAPGRVEPRPDGPRTQLYDLAGDLGETDNVSAAHPDVVDELRALLERLRRDGRSRPR